MWLVAPEVRVRLEMLDEFGECVFTAPARLMHLDETYALVALDEQASARRLCWGAPVRFELEQGDQRLAVTGSIVARQEEASGRDEVEESPDNGVCKAPLWQLRIRVWDCAPGIERRAIARRSLGFRVVLKPTGEELESGSGSDTDPAVGWCIDVGAGGMRVRVGALADVPQRMRVEFSLPTDETTGDSAADHHFCLASRVIRAVPNGSDGDEVDIALCFEGLTVRDGMALHNLLA